jgi:hypothetical protein
MRKLAVSVFSWFHPMQILYIGRFGSILPISLNVDHEFFLPESPTPGQPHKSRNARTSPHSKFNILYFPKYFHSCKMMTASVLKPSFKVAVSRPAVTARATRRVVVRASTEEPKPEVENKDSTNEEVRSSTFFSCGPRSCFVGGFEFDCFPSNSSPSTTLPMWTTYISPFDGPIRRNNLWSNWLASK